MSSRQSSAFCSQLCPNTPLHRFWRKILFVLAKALQVRSIQTLKPLYDASCCAHQVEQQLQMGHRFNLLCGNCVVPSDHCNILASSYCWRDNITNASDIQTIASSVHTRTHTAFPIAVVTCDERRPAYVNARCLLFVLFNPAQAALIQGTQQLCSNSPNCVKCTSTLNNYYEYTCSTWG